MRVRARAVVPTRGNGRFLNGLSGSTGVGMKLASPVPPAPAPSSVKAPDGTTVSLAGWRWADPQTTLTSSILQLMRIPAQYLPQTIMVGGGMTYPTPDSPEWVPAQPELVWNPALQVFYNDVTGLRQYVGVAHGSIVGYYSAQPDGSVWASFWRPALIFLGTVAAAGVAAQGAVGAEAGAGGGADVGATGGISDAELSQAIDEVGGVFDQAGGAASAATSGAGAVGDITDQELLDAIDQSGGYFDSADYGAFDTGGVDFTDVGSGDYSDLGDIGNVDFSNPVDIQDLAQSTFPDVSTTTDWTGVLNQSLSEVQNVLKVVGTAYSAWQALGGQHPKVAQTSTDASGNQLTPNKNGTVTVHTPNGQTYTTVMKPGVPYAFPDGTIVMNNGNGTYTVVALDGTTQTLHYPSNITSGGGVVSGAGGVSTNTLLIGGLGLAALLLLRR